MTNLKTLAIQEDMQSGFLIKHHPQMSRQLGMVIGYTRTHGLIECIALFVIEHMHLSIGKYGKTAVLRGHIARAAVRRWTEVMRMRLIDTDELKLIIAFSICIMAQVVAWICAIEYMERKWWK